jgi:hypothetical protein
MWWRTHPHLSRLGNISLGLEQLADVQSLAAPEVSVDAPVEGELEGPPVEASAASSVPARSRRYGGVGLQDVYFGAHGGDALPVVWSGEGRVVVRGRNASLSSRMCLGWVLEVARLGAALRSCL